MNYQMEEEGDPLPGAYKTNKHSLKSNFSASKSTRDQNIMQYWQQTTLQTWPMEGKMWNQALLHRIMPRSICHTVISQQKLPRVLQSSHFSLHHRYGCSACTSQLSARSSHGLTRTHLFLPKRGRKFGLPPSSNPSCSAATWINCKQSKICFSFGKSS